MALHKHNLSGCWPAASCATGSSNTSYMQSRSAIRDENKSNRTRLIIMLMRSKFNRTSSGTQSFEGRSLSTVLLPEGHRRMSLRHFPQKAESCCTVYYNATTMH